LGVRFPSLTPNPFFSKHFPKSEQHIERLLPDNHGVLLKDDLFHQDFEELLFAPLIGLRIDLFHPSEQLDDQGALLSELDVVAAQAIKIGGDSV